MTTSVAELCQQQKLTVLELAERAGLDSIRITAIVLGRWTPSPDDRRKVAEALGVGVDEITWGHKTPIQHIYGQGPA